MSTTATRWKPGSTPICAIYERPTPPSFAEPRVSRRARSRVGCVCAQPQPLSGPVDPRRLPAGPSHAPLRALRRALGDPVRGRGLGPARQRRRRGARAGPAGPEVQREVHPVGPVDARYLPLLRGSSGALFLFSWFGRLAYGISGLAFIVYVQGRPGRSRSADSRSVSSASRPACSHRCEERWSIASAVRPCSCSSRSTASVTC